MRRVRVPQLSAMKRRGEKIVMLTAYDATFARLFECAGVDVMLVGDSLGMVIQGHATTVPVTVDDMVYHARAVARGTYRPFLVADLPFMSYSSPEVALANSVRLMQEGGAVHVAGRLKPDDWNGREGVELEIEDVADPRAVLGRA